MSLTTLDDRVTLTEMLSILGRSLDEHRFDDLKEVFTEDVTGVTPGGTAHGRGPLIDQARRNHEAYDRLQHRFSDVLISFDHPTTADEAAAPARATLRANLVGVFGYAADIRPARQLGAVYQCTAVRTDEGWRFSEFEVRPVWRIEL